MTVENEVLEEKDNDLEGGATGVLPETIEVDGKTYTPEEIRNLQEVRDNTMRDYHKKMEEVKRDKEEALASKQKLEEEELRFQKAKRADVLFYTTNPVDSWKGYDSEVDKIMGVNSSASRSTETVENPSKKEIELEKRVTELSKTVLDMQAEMGREKADDSIAIAESLIKTSYPFADIDSVQDRMFKFFHVNRKIPTKLEIEAIVKEKHNRIASLPVVRKASSESPRLPSPKEGYAPTGLPKELPKLSDTGAQIEAGKEFFRSRQRQRSSG